MSTQQPARDHADHTAPLAMFLWVVVLVALAYGVIATADKMLALFSG